MARPLSQLKPGESGVVVCSTGDHDVCQRLREMGVLEGTLLRVVRYAPLGDPIEIAVRGYRLSLRRKDAASILVQEP